MKLLKSVLAAALLLMTGVAGAVDDVDAKAVVEKLHESLLGAMHGGAQLGFKGREELLAPSIDSSFDFDSICRIVTGRYWKAASDEQKARFISVFKKLSVAT